jgi:hypothetical protein
MCHGCTQTFQTPKRTSSGRSDSALNVPEFQITPDTEQIDLADSIVTHQYKWRLFHLEGIEPLRILFASRLQATFIYM